MIFPRSIATAMLFGGVLLLGACSSSDSDSGNGDAEKIAAARSAAINSISNNMDASIDSVNTVVSNSTAADVVIDAGVIDVPAETVAGPELSAQANAFIQSLSGNSNNTILPMTSHDTETSVSAGIEEMLTDIMDGGTVDGDTIVYRPNVQELCADPVDDTIDENCRNFLQHVAVVQQITSDTSGTLTFKFDSYSPFVIGYSSNSVYFETNLAQLNNALVAAAAYLPQDIPQLTNAPSSNFDSFEGVIRLTITKLGEQHGSIAMSIREAINVAGTVDGQYNSITVAVTDKVFEVTANAITEEATISFGLGAVTLQSAMEDMNNAGIMLPTTFNLEALEGLISFSSNNGIDTLVGSGINLGGSPVTLNVDNTEALNVSMDTLGFTVDGNQQTVTLDTGLDFNFAVTNVNAVFADLFDSNQTNTTDTSLQGSLGFTAPAATVFTDLGVPANDLLGNNITEVTQGGPFAVTGTGYFLGDATVNQSQCFTEPTDGNFPIIIVDCPAAQ